MGKKTIILTESQFNEICGANTAYLDNTSDYKEDGLTTTKAVGAVSNSDGEKEYSEPVTTKDIAHEMSPETLFALLFRNGGNGLWAHWGSGLRTNMLDGFDNIFDGDTEIDDEDDEIEYEIDDDDEKERHLSNIFESNSELEGNTYVMDLGDGKKKRSYTSLTTEKNELEQEIVTLRRNGNLSPEGQAELQKKMDRLYRINMKLGMETKRVKDQKRIKKDIFGNENAFIKSHTKDSKNGKAHSKKTKDPNVGTGYITYA